MIIRAALSGLPILMAMDKLCFPDEEMPDWVENNWWFYYVEGETFPVAYAGLQRNFLSRCGVHPLFRGRGIQKELIELRKDVVRTDGVYDHIWSYTSPDNCASINSLISSGFKAYEHPEGDDNYVYWRCMLL